ncbi:MAG: hypothetical protein KBA60_08015, partial [Flavobacteriales bacterium]|nr:hypothetical protein [Flavobacteriales bacterium]
MIKNTHRYLLILSQFLFAGLSMAQVCSVDLGSDETICQGETHTFTAPAGFPDYLWSTGSNATSITVGTAGVYWGEVSYPSGQLFTNGDFSAGNSGFSTQFNYSSTLVTEGNYFIGTNAAAYHPQFQGTGSGNIMIVNSGWPSALFDIWCQSVTVCPEQSYTLSYRVRTVSNDLPARLQWWVDGSPSSAEITLPNFGGWQTISYAWTSGAGQTAANLCLRVMSGDGIGNDFALDDISMQATITLRDEVELFVTPLPLVDLGQDVTLCAGQNLVLDAAVPGGTYVWQDGSTASSFIVNGAGNYSVTVTANDCSASDAIDVAYTPLPVVDLGADQVLCVGEAFLLNAQVAGGTYVWQNGSPAPFFNVTTSGTYSVSVTANNCTASDVVDFTFNPLPIVDLGADQTVCADVPVLLDATIPGATYLWQDGSTGATFAPTVSGPYSVTVTLNNCVASDATNITFTPLPAVDLGPDQTVCAGTAVLLDATVPGGTYLWQDGSTGATFAPITSGTYIVTVTANGCSASDAVDITVNPLPIVDLGADQTVCADVPVLLDATVPGATYLWQDGSTGAAFAPIVSGPYSVTVTLNNCVASDATNITFTPLPVVDLGPDQTVCAGT